MASCWNTHQNQNHDDLCDDCQNCCGNQDYDDCCDGCQECGCRGREKQVEHRNKPNKSPSKWRVETMNSTIAKLFEKTADAVLVNKYYGHQITQSDIEYIKLNGSQKEILAEAKAKQDSEDSRNHVVQAQIIQA